MTEATMTEAALDAPPATEASPAFLRAVADFGGQRAVVTSQAIYNAQGTKLLEGGVTVDQGLYDRLVSHRLALPLDECVEAEGGVTGADLQAAARATIARWPFFARLAPTGAVRNALLDAIEAIALPRPVALHLTMARDLRPSLYEHGIQMALLAAHLAKERGGGRHGIGVAAAAGLLHDLGMLHIDAALLDSSDRLSGDQLRPVYVHPLTASMLVDRFDEYPKEMVRAVLEHHERLDGSGYPRGLSGAATSPLGRLLALAEVVTAMFDGERQHPEQRVSLMLRVNPRRYDPDGVAAVHKLLAGGAPPPEADDVKPGPLVERLLQLAGVLAGWPAASTSLREGAEEAELRLLVSLDEQNATLQRMLNDAGCTAEQLRALGADLDDDAALRLELWVLSEELSWQLHAGANQLVRRWSAGSAHPPGLTAWLQAMEGLDAPSP